MGICSGQDIWVLRVLVWEKWEEPSMKLFHIIRVSKTWGLTAKRKERSGERFGCQYKAKPFFPLSPCYWWNKGSWEYYACTVPQNYTPNPVIVLFLKDVYCCLCAYLCLCICACLYGCLQRPEESIGSPGAGSQVVVSHLTWSLRTEIWSSARAASTATEPSF